MKIATITFHRAINFGAVLQAYALQKELLKLGHETEILDYRSEFIEKHYAKGTLKSFFSVRKIAIILLRNGYIFFKREKFDMFVKNNIKVSSDILADEDLKKIEHDYDLFITGSDQVWNYLTAGFDKNYFLEFVKNNNKKMSYAASLGLSVLPHEYVPVYEELLIDFKKISVREKSGETLLSELLDRNDISTVVDPTLLLTADEWQMLEEKMAVPERYVLVYLLYENSKILNFAKKLAKQNNCKILYINDRLFKTSGMDNLRNLSPGEWLFLFRNADYIVTNSFHGTVFSLIFEKIFWVDYLSNKNSVNSRVVTLLEYVNLTSRVISGGASENDIIIDYNEANNSLAKYIIDSKDFLKRIGD